VGTPWGDEAATVLLHRIDPVPGEVAQDKPSAEAARVLRLGGWFAGTDSRASDDLLAFHDNDIYQPETRMRGRIACGQPVSATSR